MADFINQNYDHIAVVASEDEAVASQPMIEMALAPRVTETPSHFPFLNGYDLRKKSRACSR